MFGTNHITLWCAGRSMKIWALATTLCPYMPGLREEFCKWVKPAPAPVYLFSCATAPPLSSIPWSLLKQRTGQCSTGAPPPPPPFPLYGLACYMHQRYVHLLTSLPLLERMEPNNIVNNEQELEKTNKSEKTVTCRENAE